MQINQQICRRMEELDNMEENSPDNSQVQGAYKCLTFLAQRKYDYW